MTGEDGHRRPDGVSDEVVEAVGTLSEALEYLERAKGHLYTFHQLMGRVDILAQQAADGLAAAGHDRHADLLRREVVGRNVLDGRWTFQVVEEFGRTFDEPFRRAEERVRGDLMAGRRHVYEAELKERERSRGRAGHEARPAPSHDGSVDAP